MTDVERGKIERERKRGTRVLVGVERLNNQFYWGFAEFTDFPKLRHGTPTTTTGSSTITGSRPAGQNVFVKEFHSSKRRTSLARTRVPSTPAIVNRDLCPFGDTRAFILRSYTSSFASLAGFKRSAVRFEGIVDLKRILKIIIIIEKSKFEREKEFRKIKVCF